MGIKKCEYCDRTSDNYRVSYWKALDKTLCHKHMSQIKRNGKVLKKTIYEPNDMLECEDYAIIYLYDKTGEVIGETYIDKDDINKVSKYRWGEHGNGYVTAINELGKRIYLHRYILGVESSSIVDHMDICTKNNRKSNLRECNMSKNIMNSSKPSDNKSGVKGILWDKERSKWRVEIKKDKTKQSKRFDLFDDATKQRIIWESEFFKEYSNNYNPQTQTIQLTYLSHDDSLQTYIECDLQGQILQFTKLPN